jgi:hypothetical protein
MGNTEVRLILYGEPGVPVPGVDRIFLGYVDTILNYQGLRAGSPDRWCPRTDTLLSSGIEYGVPDRLSPDRLHDPELCQAPEGREGQSGDGERLGDRIAGLQSIQPAKLHCLADSAALGKTQAATHGVAPLAGDKTLAASLLSIVYAEPNCPHSGCGEPMQAIDFRLEYHGRAVHDPLVRAWWNDTGFAGRCPHCSGWIHLTIRSKRAITADEAARYPQLPDDRHARATIL